jgi:hypothetical protein
MSTAEFVEEANADPIDWSLAAKLPTLQLQALILREQLVELTSDVAELLYHMLVKTFRSRQANPVEFDQASTSTMPQIIRDCTQQRDPGELLLYAEELKRLHGAISGSLALFAVNVDGQPGIILLRMHTEQGLQWQEGGELNLVRNLLLTEKTKLRQAALFVRYGTEDSDLHALAVDKPQAGEAPAASWLLFLGCQWVNTPSRNTRRFYDAVVAFADERVPDPEAKEDLYTHLHSEMRSKKELIDPESFARDYVGNEQELPFLDYLDQQGVGRQEFPLETREITSRLRQRSYRTRRGARISAPAESEGWLEIRNDAIVIRDEIVEVD